MRALWSIAAIELRRRMRNRSALITAFIAPLVLGAVFGVLVGGGGSVEVVIGLADDDRSAVSRQVVDGLLASSTDADPVDFRVVADALEARHAVDQDTVDAAIVLAAGFGASTVEGGGGRIEILRDARHSIAAAVATSIADDIAARIAVRSLAAATIIGLTGSPPSPAALAEVELTSSGMTVGAPTGRPLEPAAYFGASMSILFLFFTASFAAQSLTRARETGLVARQLAAGVSPQAMATGTALAVSAIGALSFVTVWGVTSVAFGASWGDRAAVSAAIGATVVAVGGVAVFVAGFARTPRQAESFASVVAFAFALLGGNFIGPGEAPGILEQLSRFTPNGQALKAFTEIAADGARVGDVIGRVAALIGLGVVFGVLGLGRMARTVLR